MRLHSTTILILLHAALSTARAHAQATELSSVNSSGVQSNGGAFKIAISGDARYVVFSSVGSNLAPNDANDIEDIFLRNRVTGVTELESVDSFGAQANAGSKSPVVTSDGRFVAFQSSAFNLVPGDTNGADDVFVRDRATGIIERVSLSTAGAQGDNLSRQPSISSDGRFVAFAGLAGNLVSGDTNGVDDVFVRDRQTGVTELISVSLGGGAGNSSAYLASISADGRYVAFASTASDLVLGDANGVQDIFVRDRTLGTTEIVSVSSSGAPSDGDSFHVSMSADGRWVAFSSKATNLVAGDTNGVEDVFVRDRIAGTTERVSLSSALVQANGSCSATAISAHGRYVAFESEASDLVLGDTNGFVDVFVHDLVTAETARISVGSNGAQGDGDSRGPTISGDGRHVGFASAASTLHALDVNQAADVFVRDRGDLQASPFCFGDGTESACPCGNSGGFGRGCGNSAGSSGALLTDTGEHDPDTLVLTSFGEPPSALSVFLQGSTVISGTSFGDGVLCTGGMLKRLYVKHASAGVVSAPAAGDPSITLRSATLGDPIAPGTTRYYQTYYRDPSATFCPPPQGNTWNVSNGVSVLW